jgi:hypothetical protein
VLVCTIHFQLLFFAFSSSQEKLMTVPLPAQIEGSSDGDTDDEESLDSDDLSS